ncbi:MAG: hypothetical protein KDC54_19675, partial [Lewinella sp.]|nr:hypothetical protein [Lewinella sp.]
EKREAGEMAEGDTLLLVAMPHENGSMGIALMVVGDDNMMKGVEMIGYLDELLEKLNKNG